MGHRDGLLMTLNLSEAKNHGCRPHPRGSVRRASGFVLTGYPVVRVEKPTPITNPWSLVSITSGLPTIRPKHRLEITSHIDRANRSSSGICRIPARESRRENAAPRELR